MIANMSEARLNRIGSHLDKYVDQGKFPCVSVLVYRDAEEVYSHFYGQADVERSVPVNRDTVFRIYSMTKPITSVALMSLYEQGLFQLDDPVSEYIPEWKDMGVYESGEGDAIKTRPPEAPLTVKNLLTHTSGLTYGFMRSHPVDDLYRSKQIEGGGNRTLKDMINNLAGVPLLHDPGTLWRYSVSTDVCGYLVEVLSGMALDEYVEQAICQPLNMSHSGFTVKEADREKFAACYNYQEDGFKLQDEPTNSRYHQRPAYLSGGGGMVSTIDDYMSFANMLLGHGDDSENPILGSRTRRYMMSNHLPGNVDLAAMGQAVFSETSFAGVGFGLGFSVVVDPATSSVLDSKGSSGWGGAASTYFWVDPVEQIAVVFMTQLLPSSSYPVRRELKTLVNQAIVEPEYRD